MLWKVLVKVKTDNKNHILTLSDRFLTVNEGVVFRFI